MILARKTKISKWDNAKNDCMKCDEQNTEQINFNMDKLNADVVTSELRTSSNSLSTWVIERNSEDNNSGLEDVVIALITGSKVAHIETIDLILIDTDETNIFKIDNSEDGDTSVINLKKKHYNICNISYKQLGEISKYFMYQVQNKKYYKLSKGEIKEIIKNAFNNKKVEIENFADSVREEIRKIITS